MENSEHGNTAENSAEPQQNWQQAENHENQMQASDNDDLDLRSAEANGYGTDGTVPENHYAANDEDPDDDDDDDNDDNDNDEEDEEEAKSDWGSVDPQEHPGLSSDMDPSGPGSAV